MVNGVVNFGSAGTINERPGIASIGFVKRHTPLLVIIIGILIRLPLLFTPLTNGLSDNWRYADTASIAHNFIPKLANSIFSTLKSIGGGNGPGYVETEFQLYTFTIALLYSVFGELLWLGRLLSLLFTVPTLFLLGFLTILRHRQPLLPLIGTVANALYFMVVARYAEVDWGIQYHIYFIPFAALGVGIGVEWVVLRVSKLSLRNPIAQLSATILIVCWLFIAVTTVQAYKLLLRPHREFLLVCANYVERIVPPEARIIVSATSPTTIAGIPNNYQEPNIFFYSHRYGWSLASDQHSPTIVDQYRRDGAQYFVIYEQQLLNDNPDLASYLETNARQVGPGIEQGCGIYRFLGSIGLC